ncbi:MAG: LamG-like jellyroll fold domain-containing protein [Candidatus Paceibacterota bacterium]
MGGLKRRAFTLIELLVVIAIIGILSALIVVGMNSTTQKATIAKAQVFSNSLRNSLMSNLISEWKFESGTHTDGQGADANDAKDTWGTNNATSISGALIKEGSNCMSSKCLSFDGNDYVDYGTGSSFNFGNGTSDNPFTFNGWFKMADATSCGFMGRFTNPSYQYSFYSGSTDKLTFILYDADSSNYIARRSVAVTNYENQWINLVATYDGLGITGMRIYLNGVRVDSADLTSGSYTAMELLSVNNYVGAGGGYMNGQIDEVRVFNAAIPTSQIEQMYFAGINKLFAKNQINQIDYRQRLTQLSNNFAKQ